MTVLVIEEYTDCGRSGDSVPKAPPVAVQQITIGATTASNTLNAATRYVVLQGTGDCRVQFAAAPVAVDDATCIRIPSGQFRGWTVSANCGLKIAAVTAA